MTDVRQWERETAPTLTEALWSGCDVYAAMADAYEGCGMDEPRPPGIIGPAGVGWTLAQCRALLAHLREVAEGLSGNAATYLTLVGQDAPREQWSQCCAFCGAQEVFPLGLVAHEERRGHRLAVVQPLGRAVARYLERQR